MKNERETEARFQVSPFLTCIHTKIKLTMRERNMTNQASPARMALGAKHLSRVCLSLAWQLAREPFPSNNPRDT